MLSLKFRKDTNLAVIFYIYVSIHNIKYIYICGKGVFVCLRDWILYVPPIQKNFWNELIDKYITINTNSKTAFTDNAMLNLEFYNPHMFSLLCQSLCLL